MPTHMNGSGVDSSSWLQSCYCIIDDADAHYRNAKAGGAVIVEEFGDYEFIGSGYSCKDPAGHVWNVRTRDPRHLDGHKSPSVKANAPGTLGASHVCDRHRFGGGMVGIQCRITPSPSARVFDEHLIGELAPPV